MSTQNAEQAMPTASASPSTFPPVPIMPSTAEISSAWVCYALFGVAIFMGWPALIATLICYVKRGSPNAGFVDSHYRWLIATFWWWLFMFATCVAVIVASAGPIVMDIVEAGHASGGDWGHVSASIHINWGSLFFAAGIAALGGFALMAVWFWVIYRVVRGAIRLGDARAVP